MNTIYDYKKCFWAIPLAILLNIECLRPETEGGLEGDLNSFFLNSFFDVRSYDGTGHTILIMSFMSLSFILIFSILCGMDIYRELYSSGVYVIIRVKSKKKWIGSLIRNLAQKAFLFSLLYAVTTWILQKHYTQMDADRDSVFAFALAVVFLFFMTFFIALVINYLSIRVNSRVGAFGGVGILLLMLIYILFYDKIPVLRAISDLRYLAPIYVCNLFYDKSILKAVLVLSYYICILLLSSFYFVSRVEMLDIKLINEDI